MNGEVSCLTCALEVEGVCGTGRFWEERKEGGCIARGYDGGNLECAICNLQGKLRAGRVARWLAGLIARCWELSDIYIWV